MEWAFQIEHNTAWAALYGFPSQKITFHEPYCAVRRSERVNSQVFLCHFPDWFNQEVNTKAAIYELQIQIQGTCGRN